MNRVIVIEINVTGTWQNVSVVIKLLFFLKSKWEMRSGDSICIKHVTNGGREKAETGMGRPREGDFFFLIF